MPSRTRRLPFAIEEIAVVPAPGMGIPSSFAFSHDDRLLTCLFGSGTPPVQQLQALDTSTGATSTLVTPPGGGVNEENLSPEEELRRQRERSLSVGLTRYALAEQSDRILVPLGGDIYVQDGPGARLRKIVDNTGQPPALTPAFSPDGEQVAYAQDGEVYVVPAAGGAPKQLTYGAREAGMSHGLAEFIAQEELDRRDGFWWSPDGRWIAFAEVDERHIPPYRIVHQGKDTTGPDAEETHHYPFSGAANAIVRLAVVAAEGGEPIWMDLDTGGECYLARVFWWKDGSLGAVLLNRAQTALEVARFDVATGKRTSVLRETAEPWLNLPPRPLAQLEDGRFLWLSERSGFRHLYLYAGDGTLIRRLTDGAWLVDEIAGVDEPGGQVYFTGTREGPTQSQLYAVPLQGGGLRRITTEPGTHEVTTDHTCRRFVDVRSALDTPPTVTLRSLEDGSVLRTIHAPSDPRIEAFRLTPPEIVTLRNRHGDLLFGAIYRPPASFRRGPYPTIVQVYGGPHAQRVADSWGMTADLQAQYLRHLGFLVFRLDNRGSARRGLAFEEPIARHMGTIEVEDQVDGVRWLVEQGLTDPERVGVTGWSYGGYMTLMCLAKAPDVFKVGVSGAPVTDWDGYDTAYTERYMGTPQSNPEGYASGSVLRHVHGIAGRLLLVHGMLDENVHFRHTARLINALTRARKPYDALLFPDERHMPRHQPDRVYQQERVIGYFEQHLLPARSRGVRARRPAAPSRAGT
jgi:dipeptidyl-peptidase 4